MLKQPELIETPVGRAAVSLPKYHPPLPCAVKQGLCCSTSRRWQRSPQVRWGLLDNFSAALVQGKELWELRGAPHSPQASGHLSARDPPDPHLSPVLSSEGQPSPERPSRIIHSVVCSHSIQLSLTSSLVPTHSAGCCPQSPQQSFPTWRLE